MKILLDMDQFSVVELETDWHSASGYRRGSVYAGYYLRTFKRYWYRIDLDGGTLKRMKLVYQHRKLEELYQEVRND